MLTLSRNQDPIAKHAADTRLLEDIARFDRLNAASGMERLEAEVGRERTSQLLLLLALWPVELMPTEAEFCGSLPAIRAA
jgi:hypothetical protein